MWKYVLAGIVVLILIIFALVKEPIALDPFWIDIDKLISTELDKISKPKYSVKRLELPLRTDKKFQFKPAPILLAPGASFVLVGPPGAFVLYQVDEGGPSVYSMLPVTYTNEEFKAGIIKFRSVAHKARLFYGYFSPDRYKAELRPPSGEDSVIIYTFDSGITAHFKRTIGRYKIIQGEPTPVSRRWEPDNINAQANIDIAMSRTKEILLCLSILPFLAALAVVYSLTKKIWTRNIGKPYKSTSMRFLWGNGERNFWCPHCARPLEVIGRFNCPAGHIPDEPVSAFENCYKCTGVINGIVCECCGWKVNLNKATYNPEEIRSRGKEFISRPDKSKIPYAVFVWVLFFAYFALLWILVVSDFIASPQLIIGDWKSYSIFTDIFWYLHGYLLTTNFLLYNPVWGPLYAVCGLCLMHVVTFFSITLERKEIMIENPYG